MTIANHMDRVELLAYARSKEPVQHPHLNICNDCREIVETLRQYYVAGANRFPEPPESWVDAVLAQTHRPGVLAGVKSALATLVWDSWAQPGLVGLRSTGAAMHRRCTFSGPENVTIDLRAEKNSGGWTFVAEIEGIQSEDTAMLADGAKVEKGPSGLYSWATSRPLHTLVITTETGEIRLPKMSWKSPRT